MGEGRSGGFVRRAFVATVLAITALVLVQTVAHLVAVIGLDQIGTFVDLDRSNGLPDIVSTLALALAAVGAGLVAGRARGGAYVAGAALTAVLTCLTLADLLHDGAHPSSRSGPYVIALVLAAGLLLLVVGRASGPRARVTFGAAALVLAASFFVEGIDRLDHRFEGERGDPIAEYQIVAKEGFELLGWSLVALGLWDEALRRRRAASLATAPASRARAASRRRAA
jgi:hypothetical protein